MSKLIEEICREYNMKEYEEIIRRYDHWISHRPYRLWDLEKFRALPQALGFEKIPTNSPFI